MSNADYATLDLKGLSFNKPHANIDKAWGPYPSLQAALDTNTGIDADLRVKGFKFGVEDNENNSVKEYIFTDNLGTYKEVALVKEDLNISSNADDISYTRSGDSSISSVQDALDADKEELNNLEREVVKVDPEVEGNTTQFLRCGGVNDPEWDNITGNDVSLNVTNLDSFNEEHNSESLQNIVEKTDELLKNSVNVNVNSSTKTFAIKTSNNTTVGTIVVGEGAGGSATLTLNSSSNTGQPIVVTLPNLVYDDTRNVLQYVGANGTPVDILRLTNLTIKDVFAPTDVPYTEQGQAGDNIYTKGDLILVGPDSNSKYDLNVCTNVVHDGQNEYTYTWTPLGSINNVSLQAEHINFTSESGLQSTDVQHALDEVNIIGESTSESDLDIADTGGNVLARFADGHFQTKNFNSSEQVALNQKLVETIDTSSTADLELCDNIGNVLVQFSNGHIKTKYFNSQNVNAKKSIRALFIGNSVNQDHITYLPWLLKNTFGDDLDFYIYIFYIGGYTIRQYVESVITGTKKAEIFSTAINTASWTNENNTVSLANALARDTFDIISVQGYFGPRTTEDITEMPTLVKWISDTYGKPFKLGYMMHQTYTSGNDGTNRIPDIINGVKYAIKSNPVSILFPCGFTTEEAKTFLSESVLTADGIHNQEGLPCVIGAYTVMEKLTNLLGLPSKVLGNTLRVTSSIYSSLNIPGSNGTLQTNTDTEWYNGQMAAIQAVKCGDALENICKEEMYNNIIQPTNS